MNLHPRKASVCGAISMLLVVAGSGCSKAPDPAPAVSASDPKLTDNRVQTIQNDPNMSAADKERAIAVLKSRQSSASSPPATK